MDSSHLSQSLPAMLMLVLSSPQLPWWTEEGLGTSRGQFWCWNAGSTLTATGFDSVTATLQTSTSSQFFTQWSQGCPSHEQPVSQENALGNGVKGCLASVQHRPDLIPLKPLTCCGWSLGTPFFPVYRQCHCPSTWLYCILVSRLWWKKGTGDKACSAGSRKAVSRT